MADKPFQFEQALKELEAITEWFESTDVDLDEGLKKFERGMELASALKQHLAAVENRVEKIKAKFGDGAAQAAAPTAQATDDDIEDSEAGQSGLFV